MAWKRKSSDGDKIEIVTDYEGHIDRLIREARDSGLFDNLPGNGKPLNLDDNPFAGEWGSAYRMVANAGATLPWIELGNEINLLNEERTKLLQRAERSATTIQQLGISRPYKIDRFRNERRRQREDYLALVRNINRQIEKFNLLCPVHSLAKATLQVAYEMEHFDSAWPEEKPQ